jgi:hypothetical protein
MATDDYEGKDAYQILDIPRSATKKEIKSGYRYSSAVLHSSFSMLCTIHTQSITVPTYTGSK